MRIYDVIVVGAGPAGCRVAGQMAGAGYGVALLEKRDRVGDNICCTGIIGKECTDLFHIDKSCFLTEGRSAKLFAPSGQFLRIEKDEVQALIVDRTAFDQLLAQRASKAGADIITGCYVSDISITKDKVSVAAFKEGKACAFESQTVIIANGFASKFPARLGMGKIREFISGAQVEMQTTGVDEVEVYFSPKIAPGFFAWVAPVSPQRARIGLFARKSPLAHFRGFVDLLEAEGKVSGQVSPVLCSGIPLKTLPKTYGDRVLVVGDAAGQVKPTTGGGVYYGLLSADFAVEALTRAFIDGNFSGRHLSLYEDRWKKKLGRELKIDYFARKLYSRLSDKQIEKIFTVARDNRIHEDLLESSKMSFDWHGELVLDGMKRLSPWLNLFGKYIPSYLMKSIRGKS